MNIKLNSYKLLFRLLDLLSNSKWLHKLVINQKVYLGATIISLSMMNSSCNSDKENDCKLNTIDKSSLSKRKPVIDRKNDQSDSSRKTIRQRCSYNKNQNLSILVSTCYNIVNYPDNEITGCYDVTNDDVIKKIEDKVTDITENIISANGVYISAEKMPEFKGGKDSLQKFITTNLKYPKNAIQKGESVVVYVKFIVEKDGKATNGSIVKSLSTKLDTEALRLIKKMPSWKSGSIDGEPVRVWVFLPIKFYDCPFFGLIE